MQNSCFINRSVSDQILQFHAIATCERAQMTIVTQSHLLLMQGRRKQSVDGRPSLMSVVKMLIIRAREARGAIFSG